MDAATPFVRELASSEKKVRDRALDALVRFLQRRRDMRLLDLLKVWKGLFFCFYHSDRPLTQQALARTLSYGLVPTLPPALRLPFLRAFWTTMGRDWHALDRLRLDKFMFLVRCYVGVGFEVLVGEGLRMEGRGRGADGEAEREVREMEIKTESGDSTKKRKRHSAEASTAAAAATAAAGASDGKRSRTNTNTTNTTTPAKDTATPDSARTPSSASAANPNPDSTASEAAAWPALDAYLALLQSSVLAPQNWDPDADDAEARDPVLARTLSTDADAQAQAQADPALALPKGPDGLRYHLLDVWLDELEKVAAEEGPDGSSGGNSNSKGGDDDDDDDDDDDTSTATATTTTTRLKPGVPANLLLQPVRLLAVRAVAKTVRQRAAEVLADERLRAWGIVEDDQDQGEDEDEWEGFD